MKRLTFLAATLATLFLAGSCQQENLEPAVQGTAVRFEVEVPDEIGTKAVADGNNVDVLYYAIYKDGEGSESHENGVRNPSSTPLASGYVERTSQKVFNITFDLLVDQDYVAVFWAQVGAEKNYYAWPENDDLRIIKYTDANGVIGNEEARAAFFRTYQFSTYEVQDHDVTLYRPFAQLNLGTTLESLQPRQGTTVEGTTVEYDIDVLTSQVKVKGLAKSFNTIAGLGVDEYCGQAEEASTDVYTFKMHDVITKGKITDDGDREYLVVKNKEGVETKYEYVAMNYLFANGNVEVEYDIVTDKGTVNNKVTNVPVAENFRTNIIGNLLTSKTDFEIVVDENFDNEGADRDEKYDVYLWDGESVESPVWNPGANDGQGQYEISNGGQLAGFAALINGTGGNTQQSVSAAGDPATSKVVLTADINLDNKLWTPIGFNPNESAGNEKYFSGIFDGNGYTIHNLKIDVKDQGGVGLFGAVYNATFTNLTLNNVDIKAVESESDPANISGAQGNGDYIAGGHIGAVAGYDVKTGEVTFENVHVTGLVKIEGETRAAQGQRIGGIIGGRAGSKYIFKNVSVKGDEGSYIKGYCSTAGVIGQVNGTVASTYTDVHTDIDVYAVTFGAGGITGIASNGSTFDRCSSEGDVTLDASKTQVSSYSANYPYRVGGIAGCWSDNKNGKLTLTDCSYTGTLTSIDSDGNSVEAFDYAGYVGRGYTLKNCAGSTVTVNGVNYVQADNATYGVYTVDGVYEMNTVSDLKWLGKQVTAKNTFENNTVKLTADIDLGNEQWIPIGNEESAGQTFNGVFDGNGQTISNLKSYHIGEYYFAGLFGCLDGATVKNLTIKNVDINLSGAETWGHIGAVAGWAEGTTSLENVTVNGDVKIEGEMIYEGSSRIGAVIGGNQAGNVSFTNVIVNASEDSYVKGNSHVGGIAGQLQGEASFNNCSSDINVTAHKFFAGGIIGCAPAKTTFTNCSTSGDVSVLAGRAGNINDLYRVGGVAGGWADNTTSPLVLEECSYTGTLSGKDTDDNTATAFDCAGYVGRGYSTVVDAKVIVNGAEYTYLGNGSYKLDGKTLVSTAAGLTAALAAKAENIVLAPGTYEGTFKPVTGTISSASEDNKAVIKGRVELANANVTFKYVKFDYNDASKAEFSSAVKGNPAGHPAIVGVYGGESHEAAFENCEFTFKSGYSTAKAPGAITHYGGVKLTLKDCLLEGEGNPIYAKTNVEMTGCTIKMYGNNAVLSLNYAYPGKLIFKNNVLVNKSTDNKMYACQFLSTNAWEKLYVDIQGNTGVDVVAAGSNKVTEVEYAAGSEKL